MWKEVIVNAVPKDSLLPHMPSFVRLIPAFFAANLLRRLTRWKTVVMKVYFLDIWGRGFRGSL